MARKCPLCGSPLHEENGLLVCSNCGFIAGEAFVSNRFDCNDFPFKSRSESLDQLASELGVVDEVVKLARSILRSYDLSRGGGHSTSLLLAALILASRFYGSPIPIRDALERISTEVSPSRIISHIWELKELVPSREATYWEGYISYLIAKMSRDEDFVRRLKELFPRVNPYILLDRLRIRAMREMRSILGKKRGLVLGRNPLYVAAAAVYIAGKKLGMRNISQGLIADLLGANRSTISKMLRLVR